MFIYPSWKDREWDKERTRSESATGQEEWEQTLSSGSHGSLARSLPPSSLILGIPSRPTLVCAGSTGSGLHPLGGINALKSTAN